MSVPRPGERPVVVGPRPGTMRDRRGRGHRGPMALPGPLSPAGVPAHRSARTRFDDLVGSVVAALDKHFAAEPDDVEVVVEDVPLLPPEWDEPVPLSSVTRTGDAARLVVYRLPVSGRARDEADLTDLVWEVVLDRLAEIWQVSPDDLDPRPR
ncbi:MAG: metallopeptidase family protein [Aeromicrobium erythreum]